MQKQALTVVLLLNSLVMTAQSLFRVVEMPRINTGTQSISKAGPYYRIILNDTSGGGVAFYPLNFPAGFDTLGAIKELLSYKNDTRLCALGIRGYNSASSQIYTGSETDYSLQVEALFLINQLVLKKPFNYACYPVLIDRRTNKSYSIQGAAINEAYIRYEAWNSKLGKADFNARQEPDPLCGSFVDWY